MKDQKAEKEETKKDEKPGQLLNDQDVPTEKPNITGNEKRDPIRSNENENARSANNDTIGIP